jgi:hypothetical protein
MSPLERYVLDKVPAPTMELAEAVRGPLFTLCSKQVARRSGDLNSGQRYVPEGARHASAHDVGSQSIRREESNDGDAAGEDGDDQRHQLPVIPGNSDEAVSPAELTKSRPLALPWT